MPHLSNFVIGGMLIGAVVGAILGFDWSGYRGYIFGRYWGAAISSTMVVGAILGFIIGTVLRAIFSD